MFLSHYDSPVGRLTLASDGRALCGLWLEGQRYFCAGVPQDACACGDALPFRLAERWLNAYFAGDKPDASDIPLAPCGTEFQQLVWNELTKIPYGALTTYGAIAKQIAHRRGRAVSAQAVGQAVGRNPISIIIPCHRVVGSGGNLTGYAGGLDRKAWLLKHEGA